MLQQHLRPTKSNYQVQKTNKYSILLAWLLTDRCRSCERGMQKVKTGNFCDIKPPLLREVWERNKTTKGLFEIICSLYTKIRWLSSTTLPLLLPLLHLTDDETSWFTLTLNTMNLTGHDLAVWQVRVQAGFDWVSHQRLIQSTTAAWKWSIGGC